MPTSRSTRSRARHAFSCVCILLLGAAWTASIEAAAPRPASAPAALPASRPAAPIGLLVMPDFAGSARMRQVGQWAAQALSRVPLLRCPEAGLRSRLAAGTDPTPAAATAAQLAKLGERAQCRFVAVITAGEPAEGFAVVCRLLDRSAEQPLVASVPIAVSAEDSAPATGEAVAAALLKRLPVPAMAAGSLAARRRETRSAEAWALYAESERAWAAGKPAGALADAVKATKLDRDFAAGYLLMGRVLLDQKRPVLAEAAFRKAGELDPALDESYHWLARVLQQMGRLDDALTVCNLAVAARPAEVRHSRLLGELHLARGSFTEALAAFDFAATLAPVDADAHVVRGQCLARLGRFPQAIAAVKKGLDLAPKSIRARNILAGVLFGADDADAALETLDVSIQMDPAQNRAYFQTAAIYLKLGQWQRVIDVLKTILEEADRRPAAFVAQAHKMAGQAHAALGRRDAALAAYTRSLALKRDPTVQRLIDRLNEEPATP